MDLTTLHRVLFSLKVLRNNNGTLDDAIEQITDCTKQTSQYIINEQISKDPNQMLLKEQVKFLNNIKVK